MALVIERVVDRVGASSFHEVDRTTMAVDQPGLLAEPLEALVAMLPNPLPSFHLRLYVARDGADVVATGFFGLPMIENTHSSDLHVTVALNARRQGYGAQMAAHLIEEARREGRRLAVSTIAAPIDGPSPGEQMAAKLGATAALTSIRRELKLADLDRARLEARLKELQAGPCAPYDFVSWADSCPEEHVQSAALLVPRVMSDSPRGDLDMENEVWDVSRYREYESMFVVRERHQLATAAVEPRTGRLVAFTDLNVPYQEHRVVSQFGTVVEPEFRGHRLGITVKLANLLNLLDAYPDAESVQTYNAAENVHMIAVNEAIGFRAVQRSTHWQLSI